jgi:hypothetical protein
MFRHGEETEMRKTRDQFAVACVCTIAFLAGPSCPGAIIDVPAIGRANYFQSGFHNLGSDTYAFGNQRILNVEVRSWLAFDLSGISEPIASVELVLLNTGGLGSDDEFETFNVFEVSTGFEELSTSLGGLHIFEDLGSGTILGSGIVFQDTAPFSPVTTALNLAAIISLNSAVADDRIWSIGLTASSLDDDILTSEVLFPGSGGQIPFSLTYLRITTIPAPGVLALLGAAGLSGRRRRRR